MRYGAEEKGKHERREKKVEENRIRVVCSQTKSCVKEKISQNKK